MSLKIARKSLFPLKMFAKKKKIQFSKYTLTVNATYRSIKPSEKHSFPFVVTPLRNFQVPPPKFTSFRDENVNLFMKFNTSSLK